MEMSGRDREKAQKNATAARHQPSPITRSCATHRVSEFRRVSRTPEEGRRFWGCHHCHNGVRSQHKRRLNAAIPRECLERITAADIYISRATANEWYSPTVVRGEAGVCAYQSGPSSASFHVTTPKPMITILSSSVRSGRIPTTARAQRSAAAALVSPCRGSIPCPCFFSSFDAHCYPRRISAD